MKNSNHLTMQYDTVRISGPANLIMKRMKIIYNSFKSEDTLDAAQIRVTYLFENDTLKNLFHLEKNIAVLAK
jgi:hypothetical protein